MSPMQDFAELARVLGICVAISLLAGMAFAALVRAPMPFGVALLGYTLLFASLFVGFSLGENLDLERRRGTKRWDMIIVLALCAAALALTGYVVGLMTPPLVGQSENDVLLPGLVFVGLIGGVLENQRRFSRK